MRALFLLALLSALPLTGCGNRTNTRPYGVDVTYEFLQKDEKGNVRVTSKKVNQGMLAGSEIGAAREGGGGYSVRVESVSPGSAVIKISFEGGAATLDLVPKVPQERFDAVGSAGMRITVDNIR